MRRGVWVLLVLLLIIAVAYWVLRRTGPTVDLEWKMTPRELTYRYDGKRQSATATFQEELRVKFNGTGAQLRIGNEPYRDASLSPGGILVVSTGAVPIYADMFRVGADGGPITQSVPFPLRYPRDADVQATEVTIQTEIVSTLKSVAGNIATVAFETRYRVVENAALDLFKDDARELMGTANGATFLAFVSQASSLRLSGVGSITFDIAAGHMKSAEFTHAGLPLKSLSKSDIVNDPKAVKYTVTLVGVN